MTFDPEKQCVYRFLVSKLFKLTRLENRSHIYGIFDRINTLNKSNVSFVIDDPMF